MSNRLMITAAAVALIAGTGFANAQGTGVSREGASGGSAAQQTQGAAPPSGNSAAPANRDAKESTGPSGMKSTQSEEKGVKNQRAQQEMKGGARDEKSAHDTKGEKSKGMSSQNEQKSKGMNSQNEKGTAGKDMKAEGREDRNGAMNNGAMNADKSGTASKSQTVGQAGGAAKLSTEQRTRITSVIRDQHVAPLNNVNFQVAVGARIPRDVSFHPLPTEIVSIYPEWRGYNYILVREQILVVDPRTFEIVAVLDA